MQVEGPVDEIMNVLYFEDNMTGVFEGKADLVGEYRLCLDNTMSRWTAKVVQFSIELPTDPISPGLPTDEVTTDDLSPLGAAVKEIDHHLKNLDTYQKRYRTRETVNRRTAESTNQRVLWYSLLVCLVTVVMTVLNVTFIKLLFKNQ